jgi:hypothetical protein
MRAGFCLRFERGGPMQLVTTTSENTEYIFDRLKSILGDFRTSYVAGPVGDRSDDIRKSLPEYQNGLGASAVDEESSDLAKSP